VPSIELFTMGAEVTNRNQDHRNGGAAIGSPPDKKTKKEEPDWRLLVNKVKRLERSDMSLEGWQQFGFATSRAADVEALVATGDQPEGGIPRLNARNLSIEEFWEKYEKPAIPCIIAGVPEKEGWPAWEKWSVDRLLKRFPAVPFKVGKTDDGAPLRLRCDQFEQYMQSQVDDSPLYMFDNQFGSKESREELLREYKVPSYFPDDYMALNGGEQGRPPYRWIAVGPKRSGTVMHQDPLNTSAWNTSLCGRKRWVLISADVPKAVAKGRHVMKKGEDDEAVNVFLDILPRLREKGVEMREFVQHPGETIFLPGGWWHCVINIDDTVAVTQNYAGRHNFPLIWRSARVERPCWSHRWLQAMDNELPSLAAEARRLNDEDGFDMQALLRKNKERHQKRRERRLDRAVKRAARKAGSSFDETLFRQQKMEEQESDSSGSDSTCSTSSSESDSSSSSSS